MLAFLDLSCYWRLTDTVFCLPGPPIEDITNELKLRFYGLFKQASTGPCNESAPSRLKVVQRMKWYEIVCG